MLPNEERATTEIQEELPAAAPAAGAVPLPTPTPPDHAQSSPGAQQARSAVSLPLPPAEKPPDQAGHYGVDSHYRSEGGPRLPPLLGHPAPPATATPLEMSSSKTETIEGRAT